MLVFAGASSSGACGARRKSYLPQYGFLQIPLTNPTLPHRDDGTTKYSPSSTHHYWCLRDGCDVLRATRTRFPSFNPTTRIIRFRLKPRAVFPISLTTRRLSVFHTSSGRFFFFSPARIAQHAPLCLCYPLPPPPLPPPPPRSFVIFPVPESFRVITLSSAAPPPLFPVVVFNRTTTQS